MGGPLSGITVLEVASIGPGPFCAMMLADMGAEVVRLDRASEVDPTRGGRGRGDLLRRGRKSLAVDLTKPEAVELVLEMCEKADVIMEGFRPGVMERLGLGPEVCMARNPRLVYGRMTGWGQDGPMAQAAGHDINYIALSGALHGIGRRGEKPVPPLNLVGDFGGGGMLLAYGIACALVERSISGKGQVIDAAMIEGASLLMTMFHGMRPSGGFTSTRGDNTLDTGAPFYETYETADGKYVSVGSLEPQFYAELLRLTGQIQFTEQHNRALWPEMKATLTRVFASKTRDEWCTIMEGTDVCFAPVLDIEEAYFHPHNVARGAFVEVAGVKQPAPAPRFSRTPGSVEGPPAAAGQHSRPILEAWGMGKKVAALEASGAVK